MTPTATTAPSIVVAEGARLEAGDVITREKAGKKGEDRLGGIGERVAVRAQELTGKEARECTLGHLQRGGPPTSLDRILALRFGVKAVQFIQEGKFGHMVSYLQYKSETCPSRKPYPSSASSKKTTISSRPPAASASVLVTRWSDDPGFLSHVHQHNSRHHASATLRGLGWPIKPQNLSLARGEAEQAGQADAQGTWASGSAKDFTSTQLW